jgi:hypothetical protein
VCHRCRVCAPDAHPGAHLTISGLTWDAVSGTGPDVNEERIRLKFFADVKGENSKMYRFGYFDFARGRELGRGGVKEPPPVHPNP